MIPKDLLPIAAYCYMIDKAWGEVGGMNAYQTVADGFGERHI